MGLSKDFDSRFKTFLAAWRRHDDLRHGGSISDLAAAHFELADLRHSLWMLK